MRLENRSKYVCVECACEDLLEGEDGSRGRPDVWSCEDCSAVLHCSTCPSPGVWTSNMACFRGRWTKDGMPVCDYCASLLLQTFAGVPFDTK
jgi:hypothetical protein